jgi:hypothetical protein
MSAYGIPFGDRGHTRLDNLNVKIKAIYCVALGWGIEWAGIVVGCLYWSKGTPQKIREKYRIGVAGQLILGVARSTSQRQQNLLSLRLTMANSIHQAGTVVLQIIVRRIGSRRSKVSTLTGACKICAWPSIALSWIYVEES